MDLKTLEFPRHLYRPVTAAEWHTGRRESRIVQTAQECGQAVEEGWSLTPILIDQVAPPSALPVPVPEPAPEPMAVPEPPSVPEIAPRRRSHHKATKKE